MYVYITFRYFNYVSIFQQSTSNDKSGTWFPPSRPQSPAGRDETTERIIKENGRVTQNSSSVANTDRDTAPPPPPPPPKNIIFYFYN